MSKYTIDTGKVDAGDSIWDNLKDHIGINDPPIYDFLFDIVGAYTVARGAGLSHAEVLERIVAGTNLSGDRDEIGAYNRARSSNHGDGKDHSDAVHDATSDD
jgi:hypothetical protein